MSNAILSSTVVLLPFQLHEGRLAVSDPSADRAADKLLGRGGVKGIIAENLLLKQKLLVVCRPRQRAPNLSPANRFLLGLCSLFLRTSRIVKTAVCIRPSTLLRFHDYLVSRKYRALFSPHVRGKPGPKGPSQELIKRHRGTQTPESTLWLPSHGANCLENLRHRD